MNNYSYFILFPDNNIKNVLEKSANKDKSCIRRQFFESLLQLSWLLQRGALDRERQMDLISHL